MSDALNDALAELRREYLLDAPGRLAELRNRLFHSLTATLDGPTGPMTAYVYVPGAVKPRAIEEALQAYAKTQHAAFLKQVNDKPELSKEVEAGIKKICEEFASTGAY